MSITVLARKMLWGRSGNRCAFPGCRQALSLDLETAESAILRDSGAVIGEEAHIRSGREDGPRYDSAFSNVDGYDNLVLLRPTHHTIIDKDSGSGFSVRDLVQMKAAHESEVDDRLSAVDRKQRELEERMLVLASLWEERLLLSDWTGLTSQLNSAIPQLSAERFDRLLELGNWLLRLTVQSQFPLMRRAMKNLFSVIRDLCGHMNKCMELRTEILWQFERPQNRLTKWDPPAYEKLFRENQVELYILYALVIEATKSVNWVIEAIKEDVDPYYRFYEGAVLLYEGDAFVGGHFVRLEYESVELEKEKPYVGVARIRELVERMVGNRPHAEFDTSVIYEVGLASDS